MSDQFIPLVIGSLPAAGPGAEGAANPAPTTHAVAHFAGLPHASATVPAPEACAKPEVILQRNTAGAITGIRVKCGCGRVTELNCVY